MFEEGAEGSLRGNLPPFGQYVLKCVLCGGAEGAQILFEMAVGLLMVADGFTTALLAIHVAAARPLWGLLLVLVVLRGWARLPVLPVALRTESNRVAAA